MLYLGQQMMVLTVRMCHVTAVQFCDIYRSLTRDA